MSGAKRKKIKKKAGRVRRRPAKRKAIRSKTKRRGQKLIHEKKTKDTFTAIKKSLSDMGRTFSESADKVADLLLEGNKIKKGEKARKLKEDLISRIKDVASGIKRSLESVKPKDILCGGSYEIGKLSRITRNTCVEIFNDLMK